MTLYEPPSGAGDELVRVARRPPLAVESAMLETLRLGAAQRLRRGIDLETLADRLCQVLLHVSLGVFSDVGVVGQVAEPPMPTLLDGIAVEPVTDRVLNSSVAFEAANQTIESWEKVDEEEDERLPMLRAVARGSSAEGGTRRRRFATSPRLPD